MSGTMMMAKLLLSEMLMLVSHWDLIVKDSLSGILHVDFLRFAQRKSASSSSISLGVENVVA